MLTYDGTPDYLQYPGNAPSAASLYDPAAINRQMQNQNSFQQAVYGGTDGGYSRFADAISAQTSSFTRAIDGLKDTLVSSLQTLVMATQQIGVGIATMGTHMKPIAGAVWGNTAGPLIPSPMNLPVTGSLNPATQSALLSTSTWNLMGLERPFNVESGEWYQQRALELNHRFGTYGTSMITGLASTGLDLAMMGPLASKLSSGIGLGKGFLGAAAVGLPISMLGSAAAEKIASEADIYGRDKLAVQRLSQRFMPNMSGAQAGDVAQSLWSSGLNERMAANPFDVRLGREGYRNILMQGLQGDMFHGSSPEDLKKQLESGAKVVKFLTQVMGSRDVTETMDFVIKMKQQGVNLFKHEDYARQLGLTAGTYGAAVGVPGSQLLSNAVTGGSQVFAQMGHPGFAGIYPYMQGQMMASGMEQMGIFSPAMMAAGGGHEGIARTYTGAMGNMLNMPAGKMMMANYMMAKQGIGGGGGFYDQMGGAAGFLSNPLNYADMEMNMPDLVAEISQAKGGKGLSQTLTAMLTKQFGINQQTGMTNAGMPLFGAETTREKTNMIAQYIMSSVPGTDIATARLMANQVLNPQLQKTIEERGADVRRGQSTADQAARNSLLGRVMTAQENLTKPFIYAREQLSRVGQMTYDFVTGSSALTGGMNAANQQLTESFAETAANLQAGKAQGKSFVFEDLFPVSQADAEGMQKNASQMVKLSYRDEVLANQAAAARGSDDLIAARMKEEGFSTTRAMQRSGGLLGKGADISKLSLGYTSSPDRDVLSYIAASFDSEKLEQSQRSFVSGGKGAAAVSALRGSPKYANLVSTIAGKMGDGGNISGLRAMEHDPAVLAAATQLNISPKQVIGWAAKQAGVKGNAESEKVLALYRSESGTMDQAIDLAAVVGTLSGTAEADIMRGVDLAGALGRNDKLYQQLQAPLGLTTDVADSLKADRRGYKPAAEELARNVKAFLGSGKREELGYETGSATDRWIRNFDAQLKATGKTHEQIAAEVLKATGKSSMADVSEKELMDVFGSQVYESGKGATDMFMRSSYGLSKEQANRYSEAVASRDYAEQMQTLEDAGFQSGKAGEAGLTAYRNIVAREQRVDKTLGLHGDIASNRAALQRKKIVDLTAQEKARLMKDIGPLGDLEKQKDASVQDWLGRSAQGELALQSPLDLKQKANVQEIETAIDTIVDMTPGKPAARIINMTDPAVAANDTARKSTFQGIQLGSWKLGFDWESVK